MRARLLGRRSWLALSGGALASLGAAGCTPTLPYAMQPGSLKKGSRVHAFQTASFAWTFTATAARQWAATLAKVEKHAPPLLAAMRDGGHAAQLVATARLANEKGPSDAQYEYYDANLVVVPASKAGASAKAASPLVLVGRAGTKPGAYDTDASVIASATGLPLATVRDGHFALYGLVNMLTPLNASNDALQRHAFKLLVLKAKIEAGEKADWFGGNREPAESLADIELALRVIADHHATVAAFRSEIVGVVALANGYKTPDGLALLGAQLVESQKRNDAWIASHPRPTMEDFGVAMNEFKLPTPVALLEQLDESGYLAAALTIARGVATGSVGTTLEGVSKLAPKDSTTRFVLEGLAAASRGDIQGTASAVGKLVGKATAGTELGKRLDQLQAGVASVKGGAAQVADVLGKAKGDLGDLAPTVPAVPVPKR